MANPLDFFVLHEQGAKLCAEIFDFQFQKSSDGHIFSKSICIRDQRVLIHRIQAEYESLEYEQKKTLHFNHREWVSVEISNIRDKNGKYHLTIKANEQIISQYINENAEELVNMKVFAGCNHYLKRGELCQALNVYVDNVLVESWPESTSISQSEGGKPIGGCKANRGGENANMLCRNRCQTGITKQRIRI